MKLTITEALAELKTLKARMDKKRQAVVAYVGRDARLKDPHANDGGAERYVKSQRQAHDDMTARIIGIRCAIQAANLSITLDIGGTTRSIQGWLTWRRDCATVERNFLQQIAHQLDVIRAEAKKNGLSVREGSDGAVGEIIVHLSEKELRESMEKLEETLGVLDGRLSLLNATTIIEIPD